MFGLLNVSMSDYQGHGCVILNFDVPNLEVVNVTVIRVQIRENLCNTFLSFMLTDRKFQCLGDKIMAGHKVTENENLVQKLAAQN